MRKVMPTLYATGLGKFVGCFGLVFALYFLDLSGRMVAMTKSLLADRHSLCFFRPHLHSHHFHVPNLLFVNRNKAWTGELKVRKGERRCESGADASDVEIVNQYLLRLTFLCSPSFLSLVFVFSGAAKTAI